MRKIALLITLVIVLLASRPAEACRNGNPCPLIIDLFAYALGGAVIGTYVGGTGYFLYRDLTDDSPSLEYGAHELWINASFATLFYSVAYEQAKDGDSPVPGLAFGALHTGLALHGAWTVKEEWKDPGHAPDNTKQWIVGIGYAANTVVWTAMLPGEHGRTYGIVEASVNAPIALGFGYLAVDAARDGERGKTLLFGGMAALSGAFTYHGLKTAIVGPKKSAPFDLLGTDVMPVAVSDGREVAPGLGMSGSW